ncbi:interferon regulatory factor 3 isoform X2 [Siniperca chuatsi]|uniref:Interferon regulatory factor 3 n=2 Tax=Siniperca chuatsi TaxID=119488 RepID=A0A2L1DGM3_SINCH|nr:interferon regulatory factor 3 isoform X2 [Siniperca chuatsi]AVC70699.1 interferon regulatory factor 3 [Siniperca chuatsi]
MSHSKPLLIPWLRDQIDSGRYPGVHWTNPVRIEFSIPWKHALRQDSSDTDILIFKAWAEASGNGRAQGDPSVWKRNFRSALRAKGFKLVFDNKNDAANPHKVFRWPDDLASGANSSAGSQDQDDPDLFEDIGLPTQESQVVPCFDDCLYLPEQNLFLESTANQDILQQCLKGLNIGSETEDTAGFEPPPEQQQLQNPVVIGRHALPGQQQYPVTFEGAVGEAGLPEQPARPMQGAVGGACGGQFAEQFLHTMNKTSDRDNFKTQFRISVYYRGVKVSEQLVENEAGVRLVYSPELNGTVVDHESGLSVVSLPRPGIMLDQTQANLTQRILDKLGDGLDVGVSGHVVYGQRRGEIKAFWSFSKFDRTTQPQEISKLQPQPLYLFKDFLRGILDFIDGRDCPPCSLFFCLGEKWPDPDNRPWEKKLITVEVVLTSVELLKNMAVGGGASSLQSVELQMSLEEMMEMY